MSNTPNLGLELVPSDSFQPWVAVNESLKLLDGIVQIGVQGVVNDPPVTVSGDVGKSWIVGAVPTGDFVGHVDDIALCTAPGLWLFFAAGTQIRFLLNLDNGGFYCYGAGWVLAGGLGDAPSDGTAYNRKDATWVPAASGDGIASVVAGTGMDVDNTDPENPVVNADAATIASLALADSAVQPDRLLSIITEASAVTMEPATHAGSYRYIRAAGNVTFDVAQTYASGQSYTVRATAGITLVGTGVTLTPPAGGTLALTAGMAVTVVMTGATTGDVFGQTVPV